MIRVGTDIVQISRIEAVLDRQGQRFVERILTPVEQCEFAASSQAHRLLAKRFAAKEAIAKALGTGIGRGVSWQDIQIEHDDNGGPLAVLSGGAHQVAESHDCSAIALSLADEIDYVVAFAVISN